MAFVYTYIHYIYTLYIYIIIYTLYIIYTYILDIFFDYMNKVDPTKKIQFTMEVATDRFRVFRPQA